jgi:hypothetical protein
LSFATLQEPYEVPSPFSLFFQGVEPFPQNIGVVGRRHPPLLPPSTLSASKANLKAVHVCVCVCLRVVRARLLWSFSYYTVSARVSLSLTMKKQKRNGGGKTTTTSFKREGKRGTARISNNNNKKARTGQCWSTLAELDPTPRKKLGLFFRVCVCLVFSGLGFVQFLFVSYFPPVCGLSGDKSWMKGVHTRMKKRKRIYIFFCHRDG